MSESILSGSVALITGGGGGIGRAVARSFLDAGARLVLMGCNSETLESAKVALGGSDDVALYPGDVAIAEVCRGAVDFCTKRFGGVDILVNNAAIDDEALFLDMTEEGWDAVLDVNLKGPFLLSQAAAHVMIGRGGGSIIHISSIDHLGADGPYTSYNVSKTGLLGLSRCMAVELARYHIRSNVISPGATKTEMIERVMGPELMDYMEHRFARVPMQRMVLPEEIASACLFFASTSSSGITGVDLIVDGGTAANLYIFEAMPEPAAL